MSSTVSCSSSALAAWDSNSMQPSPMEISERLARICSRSGASGGSISSRSCWNCARNIRFPCSPALSRLCRAAWFCSMNRMIPSRLLTMSA